ncbi:MAG TPA: nucleotidyl transferase AbiEii/AbiGii toxin family protein [Pirellulales bacterium]|jgi:predicted nucleotidyltransferase component of viral defense system
MNIARTGGEDFQYVLTRYALERLLYRLSKSEHASHFVLKGALLFQFWTRTPHRATRDLDLLALGQPSVAHFEEVFKDVCREAVEDDGLELLVRSIKGEQIKEEDEYQGIRIRGQAKLGNVRIPLQVDVGFGDAITPGPSEIQYPTLLDFPAPKLLAYNRETVVAEKFQAMVYLGMTNSRMKDFFDVWSLARDFEFDGALLSQAIAATFKRRNTAMPAGLPLALSDEFATDATKNTQWKAFLRKGTLDANGADLSAVVQFLRTFLGPVIETLPAGQAFTGTWKSSGPWQIGP